MPHSLREEQNLGRVDWCTHSKDILTEEGFFAFRTSKRLGHRAWIYLYDPEEKQQSARWIFPGEKPPVKLKRNRSASEKMITYFFAKSGQVATVPL